MGWWAAGAKGGLGINPNKLGDRSFIDILSSYVDSNTFPETWRDLIERLLPTCSSWGSLVHGLMDPMNMRFDVGQFC